MLKKSQNTLTFYSQPANIGETNPRFSYFCHFYISVMKDKEWSGFIAALGAAFFWSFSFIWVKIAYKTYEPLTVVVFRLCLSSVFILFIASLAKKIQRPTKKDFGLMVLMAFFEPFLYFLGESYGLKYISSTVAAVIVATIPIITPLVARHFHREKITWMNFAGMVLSFFGVAMVVMTKSFKFDASPLGVGLEFCAVLSAISYSVVLKKLVNRYNTFTLVAFQNLIGVILFIPFWFIFEFKGFTSTPFSFEAFRAIILLAVFSSICAFVLFTHSIKQLGIYRSNTFINLIPVFVAIMSLVILNEVLNLQKVIGILIVVAGLFLAQVKTRKQAGNGEMEEIPNM
jgi:drug/metabolite transporter (DMT)-like permease